MAEKHDLSMMENLYWWGIPTLFRCPQDKLDTADIALVGVDVMFDALVISLSCYYKC